MKKILQKISHNKIAFVFLVFIVLLFPAAFYADSEFDKRAILVAVAIDKPEDEYELNAALVVPASSGDLNANTEMITGKGKSIGQAFKDIGLDLGKKVSLAHCNSIFINTNLLEKEDLSNVLNYFLRGTHLTNNCMLLAVEGKNDEFMQSLISSKSINTFISSEIVSNENNLVGGSNMSIKEFYMQYYSPSKCSAINSLKLEESGGGSSGGSQSSGSSGGSSSSSGGGESGGSQSSSQGGQKTIKHNEDLILLKQGKAVSVLQDKATDFYNLMNKESTRDYVVLDSFEDEGITKNNVGIDIVNKSISNKYSLKNGIPTLDIKMKLIVKLSEMYIQDNEDVERVSSVKTHITKATKTAIEKYYKEGLKKLEELSETQKVDIFRFKEKLNKFKHAEWKGYLKGLKNEEDYLNDLKINIEFEIKGKF